MRSAERFGQDPEAFVKKSPWWRTQLIGFERLRSAEEAALTRALAAVGVARA